MFEEIIIKTTTGYELPIGAVLPYAGSISGSALEAYGWRYCDGSSLSTTIYPDLFKAISYANGRDSSGDHFFLPDYRNLFIRGVDPSGIVDKGPRVSVNQGNSGNKIGSKEAYTTSLAQNNLLTVTIQNNETDKWQTAYDHASGGQDCSQITDGLSPTAQNLNIGGDTETRPVSKPVFFIIKVATGEDIPSGSVIYYPGAAGDRSTSFIDDYHLCDGTSVPTNPELNTALVNTYGTPTGQNSILPDYRGYFLSGTVDATTLGVIQHYLTARPTQVGFTFSATQSPDCHTVLGDAADFGSSDVGACASKSSTNYLADASSGDKETRPLNTYVDFYLKTPEVKTSNYFPIGGVIGFAGDTEPTPANSWLPCDGKPYTHGISTSPTQYDALYAAIKTANGGDDSTNTFNVPNYQGQFLRGTDYLQTIDPDSATRTAASAGGNATNNVGSVQSFATKVPRLVPFQGTFTQHTDGKNNIGGGFGPHVGIYGSSLAINVAGGDPETRPNNVNVKFYIRYA
jgi:microcystin-dependent protein